MSAGRWRSRLEDLLGAGAVRDARDVVGEAWEGPLPEAAAFPGSAEEVCEVVRLAGSERLGICPYGAGTKQRLGGIPKDARLLVCLQRLNQVVDYPASDLTVTVQAGVPVAQLETALASQGQTLPLDVPFAERATIGGTVATNASGPRRLAYGTWRDCVLGVEFVTAEGRQAKGGGRVVKNVAGYDLPKLLIGSFGTVGLLLTVTFKVFPRPPATRTLVLGFRTAEGALGAARLILNSALTPQALDVLDAAAGEAAGQKKALASPHNLVVLAAGVEAVLNRYETEVPALARALSPERVAVLDGEAEAALWQGVRELTPVFLERRPEGFVVKATVPLTAMGPFTRAARKAAEERELSLGWLARAGSGIVYVYLWSEVGRAAAAGDGAALEASRELLLAADRLGGRAIIEWCPTQWKVRADLWGPRKEDFPWMRRLKAELDPAGLLNAGRFYGGI